MARIASTLISVVLLLAGCASTQRLMLGPARAPIDPSEVRIYHAAPPGSVDVAQLEAASGIGFGTPGQERAVIDRLRAEAAALQRFMPPATNRVFPVWLPMARLL